MMCNLNVQRSQRERGTALQQLLRKQIVYHAPKKDARKRLREVEDV